MGNIPSHCIDAVRRSSKKRTGLAVAILPGQRQGHHARLLCLAGHVMQHQPALQQVVSLLIAAAGRPTHNRSLKREPHTVHLPGGEGQLLTASRLVAKKKVSGVPSSLSRSPKRVMKPLKRSGCKSTSTISPEPSGYSPEASSGSMVRPLDRVRSLAHRLSGYSFGDARPDQAPWPAPTGGPGPEQAGRWHSIAKIARLPLPGRLPIALFSGGFELVSRLPGHGGRR